MKATLANGDLAPIPGVYIKVMNINKTRVLGFSGDSVMIQAKILPDLSDGKGANYSDTNIMGRSSPVTTYSYSDKRAFSLEWKFIALKVDDLDENLRHKRILESCVYPRDEISGAPFMPPPICKILYGRLLGDSPICAVLRSYSVKYDTSQVFNEYSKLPYRFDMSLQFETMYSSSKLPGQEKIAKMGM